MDDEAADIRGIELASPELVEKMRRKGRVIEFAEAGSEALRYLDTMKANANVGGELLTNILIRGDVRTIEIWEEFLHGTQKKCGLIDDSVATTSAEIHVKRFMIQHRRMIGISEEDSSLLERMAVAIESTGQ